MSTLIAPPLDKTDLDGLAANGDLKSDSEGPTVTPNWAELRRLSLLPGGFGQRRVELWMQALGVSIPAQDTQLREEPPEGEDVEPHKDERQIRLDTDRSFVLYPVGDDMKAREALKDQLYDLLVSLFRKRRRLHYFQGYHDIVSVLFLTLPQELQFPCVEKLSLHRVRDSMGTGLEPVIGLLRVLKRVIDAADPEFASLVDHTPLPYYALSNLLTLFSHDVPTLALIQHVFDYLFSRPPIAAVYLAAAIVLTRKEEVKRLTEEDEEGMIHSLLSSLPDFYEEGDEESIADSLLLEPEKIDEHPDASAVDSQIPEDHEILSDTEDLVHIDIPVVDLDEKTDPPPNESNETSINDYHQPVETDSPSHIDITPSTQSERPSSPSDSLTLDLSTAPTTTDEPPTPSDTSPPNFDSTTSATPQKSPSPPSPCLSSSIPPNPFPHRPRISLTSLLHHADTLYEQYPPTSPEIDISTIMGPQSVMLTWSERFDDLPTDDEAELIITKPDLIVLPPEPEPGSFPADQDHDSSDEKSTTPSKGKGKGKDKRHRLHKSRKLPMMLVQRKAVVASAVLVLGVAMAVYGTGGFTRGDAGNGGGLARSHREWKALSRFVGALFFGAGERLVDSMWR